MSIKRKVKVITTCRNVITRAITFIYYKSLVQTSKR
jgi:hypothetical protein